LEKAAQPPHSISSGVWVRVRAMKHNVTAARKPDANHRPLDLSDVAFGRYQHGLDVVPLDARLDLEDGLECPSVLSLHGE